MIHTILCLSIKSGIFVMLVKKMLIYASKLRFFLTAQALVPNFMNQTL